MTANVNCIWNHVHSVHHNWEYYSEIEKAKQSAIRLNAKIEYIKSLFFLQFKNDVPFISRENNNKAKNEKKAKKTSIFHWMVTLFVLGWVPGIRASVFLCNNQWWVDNMYLIEIVEQARAKPNATRILPIIKQFSKYLLKHWIKQCSDCDVISILWGNICLC